MEVKHVRNENGNTFISEILDAGCDTNNRIFCEFLKAGYDLNAICQKTGESIIFDIIRGSDIKKFNEWAVMSRSVTDLRAILLKYYNKKEISPFLLALRMKKEETHKLLKNSDENQNNVKNDKEIYELLLEYEPTVSNHSLWSKKCVSPLIYAIRDMENVTVADKILAFGGRLLADEVCELPAIIVHCAAMESHEMLELVTDRIITQQIKYELANICDSSTNNPLHLAVKLSKFNERCFNAISKICSLCEKWVVRQNKDGQTPLGISIADRNMAGLQALVAETSDANLEIMRNEQSVENLIQWLIELASTCLKLSSENKLSHIEKARLETAKHTLIQILKVANNDIRCNHTNNDSDETFSIASKCFEHNLFPVLKYLRDEFFIILSESEKQMFAKCEQKMLAETVKQMETELQSKETEEKMEEIAIETETASISKVGVAKLQESFDEETKDDTSKGVVSVLVAKPEKQKKEKQINAEISKMNQTKQVSWFEFLYSLTVEGLSTAFFLCLFYFMRRGH